MATLGGPVRVAIVTTRSVVTIQRIEPEMHSSRSVMCINRTSVESGVSRAYNQFVSRGTGLISKMTDVPAFRLDVDGDVTDGRSFELPVFLAHRLRQERRLAGTDPNEQPTALWIATGEVDADHRVKAVDGIAQKIHVLQTWIAGGAASGMPIRLLMPAANRSEAATLVTSLQQQSVSVQFLDHADEAFEPAATMSARSRPRPSLAVLVGSVALLVAAAIGIGWIVFKPGAAATSSSPKESGSEGVSTVTPLGGNAPLDVLVRESHSPEGRCYGGERRSGEHRVQDGGVQLTDAGRYCRIEISATRDEKPLRAYLVGRNGAQLSPQDLGDRGSLLPKLTTNQSVVEIAFSSAPLEPNADVSQLPRIVVRIEPASAGR